ncbi:MAG: hypothetical protein AABY86_16455 [Bdellovibrionota bacterium]
METLKQHLSYFYERHRDQLQKCYPGLTLHRMQSELAHYFNSDLQQAYIPGANPSLVQFFD